MIVGILYNFEITKFLYIFNKLSNFFQNLPDSVNIFYNNLSIQKAHLFIKLN
jgi:hypothetical protein